MDIKVRPKGAKSNVIAPSKARRILQGESPCREWDQSWYSVGNSPDSVLTWVVGFRLSEPLFPCGSGVLNSIVFFWTVYYHNHQRWLWNPKFFHTTFPLREFARNNIPVLRRIFVRIQGATMGAYCNIRALSQRRIRTKRQVRWGCLFLRLP